MAIALAGNARDVAGRSCRRQSAAHRSLAREVLSPVEVDGIGFDFSERRLRMRWQTMTVGFVVAALLVTLLAPNVDAQSRRQQRRGNRQGGNIPSQQTQIIPGTPTQPYASDTTGMVVQPTQTAGNQPQVNGNQPQTTGSNQPQMTGGNQPTTTSYYQPSGQTATVALNDTPFAQTQLQVAPGTKVLFTNQGNSAHSVISGQGLFDSGDIPARSTYDCTFNLPGTYTFYDRNNPNIRGTIIVR
jgi:plastocyanin